VIPPQYSFHVLPIEIARPTLGISLHGAERSNNRAASTSLWPSWVLAGGPALEPASCSGVLHSLSSSRRPVPSGSPEADDERSARERGAAFRLIAENALRSDHRDRPGGHAGCTRIPAFGKLFGASMQLVGGRCVDTHPPGGQGAGPEFVSSRRSADGRNRPSEFPLSCCRTARWRDIEKQSQRRARSAGGASSWSSRWARDVTERRRTEEGPCRAPREGPSSRRLRALANLGSWGMGLAHESRGTWFGSAHADTFGHEARSGAFDLRRFSIRWVHHEDRGGARRRLAKEGLAHRQELTRNQFSHRAFPTAPSRTRAQSGARRSGRGGQPGARHPASARTSPRGRLAEEQARVFAGALPHDGGETCADYAIYMLDTNGYITSWNLGAERIEGYLARRDHRQALFVLLSFPNHAFARRSRHAAAVRIDTGALRKVEGLAGVRKNGSQFWAHVILTPLPR